MSLRGPGRTGFEGTRENGEFEGTRENDEFEGTRELVREKRQAETRVPGMTAAPREALVPLERGGCHNGSSEAAKAHSHTLCPLSGALGRG